MILLLLVLKCEPAHQDPTNGRVYCDKDNQYGSFCVFTCTLGYILIGDTFSECARATDSGARWSTEAPICMGKSEVEY